MVTVCGTHICAGLFLYRTSVKMQSFLVNDSRLVLRVEHARNLRSYMLLANL